MRDELRSLKVLLTSALKKNSFVSVSEVPTLPADIQLRLKTADDLRHLEELLASNEDVAKTIVSVTATIHPYISSVHLFRTSVHLFRMADAFP